MRGLSESAARAWRACLLCMRAPLTARGRCGWPLEVWRLFGTVVFEPILCVLTSALLLLAVLMIVSIVLLVLGLTGALAAEEEGSG